MAAADIVLIIAFSLLLDRFATWGNAMVLLRSISVVGVLALGMTVVIIGGGIDLSQLVIAVVSVGAAVAAMQAGFSELPALVIGMAAALSLGLCNAIVVRLATIPPLFATLASGMLFLGIARLTLLPGATIYLPHEALHLAMLGQSWKGWPFAVLVFGAAALATHVVLSFTWLGQFIRAHGDNPRTAWAIGLPVTQIVIVQYLVSAFMAFIAGLLMLTSAGLIDLQQASSSTIFDVILIAVAGGASLSGGRGGVAGTLAAALLVGLLLDGMTILNVPAEVQAIAKGSALLAVLAADRLVNANRAHEAV